MKPIAFLLLISLTPAFSQKRDKLAVMNLQNELSLFVSQLNGYSEKLSTSSESDSIKRIAGLIEQSTAALLKRSVKLYGSSKRAYDEYAQNMALASVMEDVSPATAGVYRTDAVLGLLDEPKPARIYKQLSSIHQQAKKLGSVRNGNRQIVQAKKLIVSCRKLHNVI